MGGISDGLDVNAILELLEGAQAAEARDPNEGLRERKKRQVRQRISDVATAMFLVHGFDNVTVAQIAAKADVSEQTVFNYFTTKESMLFDRTDAMIAAVADAVRNPGSVSLVDSVVRTMPGEIHPVQWQALGEEDQLGLFRRFCEVATSSHTLIAARFAEFPHFIDEVSVALAQRVGADPNDPEVQFTAIVIAGLVRARMESTFHHVQQATSFVALNDAVHRDVLRAARLAEPSLTAFDEMRQTVSV